MKLGTIRFIVTIASLSILAGSCTTLSHKKRSRGATGNNHASVEKNKAGSKSPSANNTDQQEKRKPPKLSAKLRFIKAHARLDSTFGEKEHDFVAALETSPKKGTFAEAALTIGLVKTVLNPPHAETASFEESDIIDAGNAPASGQAKAGGLSLEKLSKERELDIAGALRDNRHLQTFAIARMTMDALARGNNSEQFISSIRTALGTHASKWSNLGAELGLTPGIAANSPAQDPVPIDVMPPDEELGGSAPSAADLRDEDTLLVEAQSLSDKGKYKDAITLAKRIKPGSPLHKASQEKIITFSNTAVQELRRKAAVAFQSSVPVTDRKIRAQYLDEARKHLEEAIVSYPDATHLPRVRENLRVISQDLERIRSEDNDELKE